MKIQSSLLILAAIAGSATAAKKRKRVFKIYSREEIRAAEATRSLQGTDSEIQETVPAVQSMSMSMTLSPSGSPTAATFESIVTSAPSSAPTVTKCTFCDGLDIPNPSFELPNNQNCTSIQTIAGNMDVTNQWCEKLKEAEVYCCPPAVVETTTATAATDAAATTTEAAVVSATTTEAAVVSTTTTEATMGSVPVPTPPADESLGAPSGAMIMETTSAALAVAGIMLLV
ncbi:hypothetical protein ACHAWT_008699 [Skeletonema menzelii]